MAMFASDKAHSITQVVMNLPNDAAEFLGTLFLQDLPFPVKYCFICHKSNTIFQHDIIFGLLNLIFGCFASPADAFRGIYKDRPKDGEFTYPMIHVYGFSKAEDPEFDFHEVGR